MNRVNITLVILLFVLLVTKSTFAEVLRWPQGCSSGQLQVTNKTNKDINGWLQEFKPSLASEKLFHFPAGKLTSIPVKIKKPTDFFSLFYLNKEHSLDASLVCKSKTFSAHSFEGGVLTYRHQELSLDSLWIQNLFTADNQFKIQYLDQYFRLLSESNLQLKSQTKTTVKIKEKNWFYARVQATNRFSAFSLLRSGSEGPAVIASQTSVVDESAAYFEVQSQDNIGDSFIAKITDPNLISEARLQISDPHLEKILFAKISKGHQGYNRNWSKTEKPFWSWSVTEVTSINDLASTSCNGLPQAVEDRTDFWVNDPGRICFWSYRIRKELKPSEVAAGEIIQ